MQRLRERLTVAGLLTALILSALFGGCGGQGNSPVGTEVPFGQAAEAPPSPPEAEVEVKPLLNHMAPEIVGTDVLTGETVRLSEQRGKVVMINFWATWCGPCRVEMPAMEAFHQEAGEDVRVMAVAIDRRESPEMLAAFAEELGLTFNVLHDGGEAFREYKVIGIPMTIFVDQTGMIRDKHTGVLNTEQMRERAEQTRKLGEQEQARKENK